MHLFKRFAEVKRGSFDREFHREGDKKISAIPEPTMVTVATAKVTTPEVTPPKTTRRRRRPSTD